MIFSKGEMICFNGILDDEDIPQIPLLKGILPEKEKMLENTIKQLKKRGIVDENNKFTKHGMGPVATLQKYKMAEKYVVINQMRVGLCGENVVVINQVGKGYDMSIVHKPIIMLALLEKCEFMRQGESEIPRKYKTNKITKEEWIKETKRTENELLITKYHKKDKVFQYMYYWNAKNGYRYDFLREECVRLQGYTMRTEIIDLLEFREGQAYG